jgi:hypothetical protein
MANSDVLPDLQASILCEDVRQEVNGMQTLVGVFNFIPARSVPLGVLKICLWTRWCGGQGQFSQVSRILSVDESEVVAESQMNFELKEMEGHVTNVNLFTGLQFHQFGPHYVEILLDQELVLRYALPVVKV